MLNVLDIFSGIGGFSLGLERTGGFKTVAFCENDEHCRKVLDKHWPKVPNCVDVKLLDTKGLDLYKCLPIDVICGGFPCQDISCANTTGKGLKGERSGLWKEYKRLIQEIKPRYAIIENVANLRSKGLGSVLKDLWEIGYDSEWHIISACSIGAVHRRERVWIIAYPNSERLERHRRSSEVGQICPQEKTSSSFGRKDITSYPDDLRLWRPFASEEERREWRTETASRFSDVFNKINATQPTICRVNDGVSRGLDKNRKQRIKMLGNSIVPQIAQVIGEAILEYENA